MPLNIPLIQNYRIRSDSNNYMLVEVKGDREFVLSYHRDIQSLIESFLERKIRGFDSTSIKGLLASIKSLQTALNTSLQGLKLEVKKKK